MPAAPGVTNIVQATAMADGRKIWFWVDHITRIEEKADHAVVYQVDGSATAITDPPRRVFETLIRMSKETRT